MKKIFVLVFASLCFQFNICKAQAKYQDIVDNFLAVFETDPLKAYENLFVKSKWIEKSTIDKNKIDFQDFLKDLGSYCGYELITKKELGQSYVLLSFLIKYERQPFRIKLSFYKPKNEWILQNFSYDTSFDEEIEDAAKFDRLLFNTEKK